MKYLIITITLSFLLCSCNEALPENRNQQASLPENFNFSGMNLKTITTFINAQNHTTSTLYGNKEAYESLLNSDSVNNKKILVLITWKQQDEPKWFGAKIPGSLISIETLKTDTNFKDKRNISYGLLPGGNSHDGKPDQADKRINDILALQPAVMP